jgi:hypothetical protein
MSARVYFLTSEENRPSGQEGLVLCPAEAIHRDASGDFVWLVRDGRAIRREVEIGEGGTPGRVAIRRGLSGGEALVLGSTEGLAAATRVEINP